MRVYRVEGPDGKGPYNGKCHSYEAEVLRSWFFMRANEAHTPSPYADPLLDGCPITSSDLFGFAKMTDLFRWFGGFVSPFLKTGYSIAIYDVPDHSVKIGAAQVIFNATKATRIK